MLSHVTIGTNDLALAAGFYDAVLTPLGLTRWFEAEDVIGWGPDGKSGLIYVGKAFDGRPASPGNGWMCAIKAASRDAVDQAYQAALAHGGSDEGPPGLRPQYAPDYYGAYFRDPEGNKLHVVHRGG